MAIVELNAASRSGVAKLISSSHGKLMDLEDVLPWAHGVDRATGLPKPVDQCWLVGTPYMDKLTSAQLQEVLWLETARDISMFIVLEQTLPPLYINYINRDGEKMSPDVYEYMMIFSKEEIVHTLMFKRFMALAGLPQFKPADGLFELLTQQLPAMRPEIGIACTLIIEWVAELAAMHASQQPGIEPMVQQLFYAHHVEEARHIAFGRWVTESYLESAPADQAAMFRAVVRGVVARMIPQFTYNPEIADYVDYPFPVASNDAQRIAEVRDSAANTALNALRFAPLFNWLEKLEIA
jgi:hypothetical protein